MQRGVDLATITREISNHSLQLATTRGSQPTNKAKTPVKDRIINAQKE